MKILAVTKISSKNLVTIPKEVRLILGVKEGDRIAFILKDGEVIIRKAELKLD